MTKTNTQTKSESKQEDPAQETLTVEQWKTADLTAHEENAKIYDNCDTADPKTVAAIKHLRARGLGLYGTGVLLPLLITKAGKILRGHRVWTAAKKAGQDKLPVLVVKEGDNLDEIEILVHSNIQREKTKEETAREIAALYVVEEERARKRQATSKGGSNPQLRTTVSEAEKGNARDKVVADLGWSAGTVDAAVKVVEQLDDLDAAGKTQDAQELRETLNGHGKGRGIHPAAKLVKTQQAAQHAASKGLTVSPPDPKTVAEQRFDHYLRDIGKLLDKTETMLVQDTDHIVGNAVRADSMRDLAKTLEAQANRVENEG